MPRLHVALATSHHSVKSRRASSHRETSPPCHPPRASVRLCAETQHVRDSIVVSMSACHAEDPGSIPGRGTHALGTSQKWVNDPSPAAPTTTASTQTRPQNPASYDGKHSNNDNDNDNNNDNHNDADDDDNATQSPRTVTNTSSFCHDTHVQRETSRSR